MKATRKDRPSGLNVLAFDTSSAFLSVACGRSDGMIAEANLAGPMQHSENLFRLISHCLERLELKYEDLDSIGVGMGPGSFTGLRIGFSCLKGLYAGMPKPVYGISSLDLVAFGIPREEERLGIIANARREKIYASFYRPGTENWERENEADEVLGVEEVIVRSRGEMAFAGDALAEYGELLRAKIGKARFLEKRFWAPRVFPLVSLLQSRCKKLITLDPESMKPQYLRLSEAEEKRAHLQSIP